MNLKYNEKIIRPCGWYINIEGNDHSGHKVKKIGVYPNKRLSLQSHQKRSEHWVRTVFRILIQFYVSIKMKENESKSKQN